MGRSGRHGSEREFDETQDEHRAREWGVEDQPGGGGYETRDIKKVYSGTNLSWAFGAGYRHESGFGINARYNLGLSNVLGKNGDGKIHSSVFNIGIVYMLVSLKK